MLWPRFTAVAALLAVWAVLTVPAGDWRVVYLQPPGVLASEALDVDGSSVGGSILMPDGNNHPALWDSEGNLIDLLPADWRMGIVCGISGTIQVGEMRQGFNPHAVIWHGSAEDYTLLAPASYTYSGANDAVAGLQVGYVGSPGPRAALWRGTRESFVLLHPSGFDSSEALATDGALQGGTINYPGTGPIHAAVWHGTADSYIDMNPPEFGSSGIYGMADGVQVGWGIIGGYQHACLWRGTPETFVDMHPTGSVSSRIYDTTGRYHVGYARFSGLAEATLWLSDVRDDYIHLHSLLGPGWDASVAFAISEHEGRLYVAGQGNRYNQREQAILWIGRIPDTDRPPRRPPTTTPGQQTKPTSANPLIP